MHITETTGNVRNLFSQLESQNDFTKLKFLIYIFGLLNNNQINSRNEANPELFDNDALDIFNFTSLGLIKNAGNVFLQYLVMIYNSMNEGKEASELNGNVIGIEYNKLDIKLDSIFANLSFCEKLDVFAEIIIRYDNGTYFEKNLNLVTFDSKNDGFMYARIIKKYKESLNK